MIINRTKRFSFIHIPKCAGTTVRSVLDSFNEWEHAGPPWIKEHKDLGTLDFAHIPLFALQSHFTDDLETIKNVDSFAIIRNPYDRFASSVSQQVKMYSKQSIYEFAASDFEDVINKNIEFLKGQPESNHLLPPEYIHFQKQIDYTHLSGTTIVNNLHTIDTLDKMFEKIENICDQTLDFRDSRDNSIQQKGQTKIVRNGTLRHLIKAAKALKLNKAISPGFKKTILRPMLTPRDDQLKPMFESKHVTSFIRNYYGPDIELYERTKKGE